MKLPDLKVFKPKSILQTVSRDLIQVVLTSNNTNRLMSSGWRPSRAEAAAAVLRRRPLAFIQSHLAKRHEPVNESCCWTEQEGGAVAARGNPVTQGRPDQVLSQIQSCSLHHKGSVSWSFNAASIWGFRPFKKVGIQNKARFHVTGNRWNK